VKRPEAPLVAALEDARRRGFLGPGEVEPHIEHALGFADAIGAEPETLVDLGSGGGLPGLVLAWEWSEIRVTLLEGSVRRAAFLRETVERLAFGPRVQVVAQRGEEAGHDPQLREHFAVTTARSFGPPAVTAEIGAGFVRVGGLLVVAEPPEPAPERWPDGAAARFGLADPDFVSSQGAHFARLCKVEAAPAGVPRRTGIPEKRPRW
jgi:16S rRNA (guanine527-N7)-methyltransferase